MSSGKLKTATLHELPVKHRHGMECGMKCGMDVNVMIIPHSGCSSTEESSCRLGIPYSGKVLHGANFNVFAACW